VTVSTGQPTGKSGEVSDEEQSSDGAIFSAYRRTQALVLIASVVSAVIFWEVAARLGIPPIARLEGSLIEQAQVPLAFIATYVLYFVAVAIGILIAGRSWFFAGIFSASVGLTALSIRCGPMRHVLFNAAAQGDTRQIFLRLVAEQCLIFVPVGLTWIYFWRKYSAGRRSAEPEEHDLALMGAGPTLGALFTQVAIMGLLVWLMSATDVKKQVTIAVFIGGFGGTSMGEYLFPNRDAARWYWLGPLVVGVVGYLAAFFHSSDWTIGSAQGALANLAHPVPLDYAGAGIIGTLLGVWVGGDRPDIVFSMFGAMVGVVPSGQRLSKQLQKLDKPKSESKPLEKNEKSSPETSR